VAQYSAEDKAALELAATRIRAYLCAPICPIMEQMDRRDGCDLGWRWTPVSAAVSMCRADWAATPALFFMNAIPRPSRRVGGWQWLCPRRWYPEPAGADGRANFRPGRGLPHWRAQGGCSTGFTTDTIAPVDKITGPGKCFVAAAKRRVFGKVGIDHDCGSLENPCDAMRG